jgi:cyanophycinase-like exopeptidase
MPGPLALVGSGEFLTEMEATDRLLLDATGPRDGHALIVPTASALEPGMPEQWAERGIRHFGDRLSIAAEAALILNREQADERFVPRVETARLIYFSGGNPRYLTETMTGSAFWQAVAARWQAGAALAGCSAGAMMLGAVIQNIVGKPGETMPALGIVPGVCVIPHFDRIEHYRPGALAAVRERRKAGIVLVGIDELTAAVCIAGEWRVSGRGKVLVVTDVGELTCAAGEKLPLALPRVAIEAAETTQT